MAKLQIFLIICTCFLYLIAAGRSAVLYHGSMHADLSQVFFPRPCGTSK